MECCSYTAKAFKTAHSISAPAELISTGVGFNAKLADRRLRLPTEWDTIHFKYYRLAVTSKLKITEVVLAA